MDFILAVAVKQDQIGGHVVVVIAVPVVSFKVVF